MRYQFSNPSYSVSAHIRYNVALHLNRRGAFMALCISRCKIALFGFTLGVCGMIGASVAIMHHFQI